MEERKTTLFAVFVSKSSKNTVLKLIKANYNIPENQIFILEDKSDENCNTYIITFNGVKKDNVDDRVPEVRNVIAIHRKKINNVLYTVNALNKLVESKIGHMDPSYTIDWENEQYHNKFIITRNGELELIPTELKTIVSVSKIEEFKF